MSIAKPAFCSFQGTPVWFVTVKIHAGMPILAHEGAAAILRTAWLHAMSSDRWLVGSYWIQPDQVSLFASPGLRASPAASWMVRWKSMVAFRINQATCGTGRIWNEGAPPALLVSERDYRQKFEMMKVEPDIPSGSLLGRGQGGMIWDLLPDPVKVELPALASV